VISLRTQIDLQSVSVLVLILLGSSDSDNMERVLQLFLFGKVMLGHASKLGHFATFWFATFPQRTKTT